MKGESEEGFHMVPSWAEVCVCVCVFSSGVQEGTVGMVYFITFRFYRASLASGNNAFIHSYS